MDFFGKLEKAKGTYEMFSVLYEYRYPLLLIVGLIVAVLIIRSYHHGKEIKKLKKVTGIHPSGSSGSHDGLSIGHIENAYFLQTTPQDAKLLIKGAQPSRLLEGPKNTNKSKCPHCGATNPSRAKRCGECGKPLKQDASSTPAAKPAPKPQEPEEYDFSDPEFDPDDWDEA